MRCEIVAVGTELLLGQIVDTNSSWLGEQLAIAGIDSLFQTKVGDNHARIVETLRHALSRSDAVVVCGGLGPTQDDITREAIAAVAGVALVRRPDIVERIRARFEARGRVMSENNARQADVPEGAEVIAQFPGTAPGLLCPVGDKVIYAVPGVPWEMHEMALGTIIPDLRRRAGAAAVIRSRIVRTWGESESGLAERLAERMRELDEAGNPTLAFQASGIEGIKVRITAKASGEAEADRVLAEEEARIRALLGAIVFGVDGETMEHAVLALLAGRGKTLAIAESLTGGLAAARLATVPGFRGTFRGAVLAIDDDVARAVLGTAEGARPSEAAARALAEGARRALAADVGLAATGVAGPEEEDGQPVGTVFLAVADGADSEVRTVRLPGGGDRIRQFAVISLLDLLRRRLAGS